MSSQSKEVVIPGFPDYAVTDDGRVISYKRGYRKTLKGSIDSVGYPHVNLTANGRVYAKNIHRLVLGAFIGPCLPG